MSLSSRPPTDSLCPETGRRVWPLDMMVETGRGGEQQSNREEGVKARARLPTSHALIAHRGTAPSTTLPRPPGVPPQRVQVRPGRPGGPEPGRPGVTIAFDPRHGRGGHGAPGPAVRGPQYVAKRFQHAPDPGWRAGTRPGGRSRGGSPSTGFRCS